MRFIFALSPRILRDLRDALHFLTRLPVPGSVSRRNLREVLGAFPLAGLVLGVVLAGLELTMSAAHIPGIARAGVIVAAWCWLTDAMHVEGLMRAVQHIRGPEPLQEDDAPLETAARPGRRAAYAVLVAKALILALIPGHLRIEALLVAPMLGRWSLALGAALYPSRRLDGLGVSRVRSPQLLQAGLLAVTLAPLAGPSGVVALIVCSLLVLRLGRVLAPLMPEHTGDLYGALVELTELAALLVCAIGVTGLWGPIIIVP